MRVFEDTFGWRSIDIAPLHEDLVLLVTDGQGEPDRLPHPCKLTDSGWVSSTKGTPLAVRPLKMEALPPCTEL